MSVPPRTERDRDSWEVSGEPPAPARRRQRPDKLGVGMVALVLLAMIIAVVALFVL